MAVVMIVCLLGKITSFVYAYAVGIERRRNFNDRVELIGAEIYQQNDLIRLLSSKPTPMVLKSNDNASDAATSRDGGDL